MIEPAEGRAPAMRPWMWSALFVVAMAGAAASSILDLLAEPWQSVVSFLALSLVVPMTLAARRKVEREGCMSPALRTYNNRALLAGGLYMLTFIIAAKLYHQVDPSSPWLWPMALVPVLPLLGMIAAMVRYIRDETDEYLRHRAMMAALVGLALVLVLGTVWGFLETFGLVPHVWSWWVFPVWAIGMGFGQFRQKAGA